MQTDEYTLQTGSTMHTEGKMQTTDFLSVTISMNRKEANQSLIRLN